MMAIILCRCEYVEICAATAQTPLLSSASRSSNKISIPCVEKGAADAHGLRQAQLYGSAAIF